MAGRGRGATLPAWMTKAGGAVPGHSDRDSGSAQGAAPAAPSPALRVAATPQSSFAASAPAVRSVPQDTMYGRQQGNGGHMGGYGQAPSMGGYGQAPSMGGYGQPPQGAGGYGRGAYGAGMPGAYSMGGGGGGGIPAGAAGGYGAMASGAPAARVIKGNSIEAQPSGPSKSVWSVNEADGRTYYYNTVTGVSQYDKPDELKSEAEKALPPCPWQEFTNAQVGRVYYHNKVTKESVWEEPQELREYKMKLSALERGLPLPVMSAPVAAPVAAPAAAPVAAPTTAAAAAAVSAAPASSAAPAAAVVSAPGVAAAANGGAAAVAPGTVPSSAAAAAPAYGVWPPGMMMQGVGGMYPQMMAPGVLPPNVTAAAAAPKVVPAAVIPQGAAVAALSAGVVPDDSAAAKAMAAAMATLNGADSSAFISSGGGARKGVKKNPKDAPPVPVVNVRVEEEEKKPVVEKKASEPVYASQEERVAAFMALLEEKKVPSTATWEEAMRIIIGDPRFKALNLAQKKSVFQEYNEKRAKVEREERDAAMSKARDDFKLLLQGCAEIGAGSKWRIIEPLLRNSPAYAALSDDRDRQQLFSNYVEDLESAERERRRQERRAKLEAFSALLKMCTFITEESKWEDVRLVKPFSDDPAYIAVDEADRVQSFKEYIRQLVRAAEELRSQEREKARLERLEKREAFRRLLRSRVNVPGGINALSLWKDCGSQFLESDEAKALATLSIAPQDEFEGIVHELVVAYKADKKVIVNLVDDANFKVTSTTTLEAFVQALTTYDEQHPPSPVDSRKRSGRSGRSSRKRGRSYSRSRSGSRSRSPSDSRSRSPSRRGSRSRSAERRDAAKTAAAGGDAAAAVADGAADAAPEPKPKVVTPFARILAEKPDHVKLTLDELVAEAKEKEEEERRRLRRRVERFEDLLIDHFYRDDHLSTTWEQAYDRLHKRSAYRDLDEAMAKSLFEAHMKSLRAKAGKLKPSSAAATAGDATSAGVDAAGGDGTERPASGSGGGGAAAGTAAVAAGAAALPKEEGELEGEEPRRGADRPASDGGRAEDAASPAAKQADGGSDSDSDDSRHHKKSRKKSSSSSKHKKHHKSSSSSKKRSKRSHKSSRHDGDSSDDSSSSSDDGSRKRSRRDD